MFLQRKMKEQLLPYSSIRFNLYAQAEHNIYSNYTPVISSSVGAIYIVRKYATPLELFVHENKMCYKYSAPPELSFLSSIFFLLFSHLHLSSFSNLFFDTKTT